jgi:hypothetical protein
MGDNKEKTVELKRNVSDNNQSGPIPVNQIPNSMKVPAQLTEQELRQENERLRNIIKQADVKLNQMMNTLSLKRLEFLFGILQDKGFAENVNNRVRNIICEELGVFDEEQKDINE